MVIEDDEVINCHVTADPGKIVSHALQYGYLTNFKIENMHEQFLSRQAQGEAEKQAAAEARYGQRVHLRRCGQRPGVWLRGRRRRRGPQGYFHRPWR
ncbi:MAG: hypothetical protein ACLRRT_07875 [Ruthenibacterium lactatiformans]